MRWIKEVEMVHSADDLVTSLSHRFTNFMMLDGKIVSSLKMIIPNSNFRKRVYVEEQKAQKDERFFRGRQIAFMIHDYFLVTGTPEAMLENSDLFN